MVRVKSGVHLMVQSEVLVKSGVRFKVWSEVLFRGLTHQLSSPQGRI